MHSAHIIIVNYNAGEWLRRAVRSALDFSGDLSLKVTVVDNASKDDSVRLAQQACQSENVEWVLNRNNVGFAAANNQVLKNLTSDYAVLMNPDCELRKGTLPCILDAFDQHENFGIAGGRILNEDLSLQATCRRRFPTPWSALVRMLHLGKLFPNNQAFRDFDYGHSVSSNDPNQVVEAISGAFMVVRREALEDVGLLDEGYFMHCEDLDWCKRFAIAGWEVGFVPSAEVLHAKGISSNSRPVKVLWTLHQGMNRFFDKFYRDSYAWPFRLTVKLGIYASFFLRAAATIVKSVVSR